jgi:uncharacterized membrane protein
MDDDDVPWRLLLPPWLRRLPADLAAVVGLTLLAVTVVFLPVVRETPVRIVFGLPFVLFAPGYALIAALFPERGTEPPEEAEGDVDGDGERSGITGLERVALSFGVSIAVVPLVGLVLNFTPFGIRLVPVVVSLTGFVLGLTAVAMRRRAALPAEERLTVPWRAWIAAGRRELFEPESRTDAALNVLLVISLVVAVSSVGYAVAVPKQGESFSEFYLLTESESGELVADDYPTEFVAGESRSLVVGIDNQEHQTVEYTVVVELNRVAVENNSTRVLDEERLRTFETRLSHNETWQRTHSVTPELTGDRLRLTYLLYQGSPPSDPTTENAYRNLHLWVNVTS